MPGIGVVTNPRSRVNKRDPSKMVTLAYLLGSQGAAEATKSLDDLYRVAETFKAAQIDILGINGGDGTIHVTLTAFLKVYGGAPFPKVAILRGGTLNTIAKGLGIKGETQQILYDVIDRYHQGEELKTVSANVLQVNDQYGFIFGNGLVANFLDAYYSTGKPSPMTGATTLLRTIGSAILGTAFTKRLFRRFRGKVTADGETWAREDFVTITAATVPEIGLGFAPFYRCSERPGHFALLGLHASPLAISRDLWRIWRGKPMRRDKAISVVAQDVRIETDEELLYTIDGDLHRGKGDLTVRTGPAIDIIIP